MSSTRPDLKFTDSGDEKLYFRKYSNLPEKDPNTIRIVDHNNKDYFTAIDEDADLIADNIYKTQSVLKYTNSHRYVTISPQVFINNVVKFVLIDKHLKLEVYHNRTFTLLLSATQGNFDVLAQEYDLNLQGLFQDCSNPVIAAVKFNSGTPKSLGVCCVDTSNRTIQLCQFEDNDLFSNLESLLLQLGVKEVVLPSNYDANGDNQDVTKLFQVIEKIGNIVISQVKSAWFTAKDIDQDLGKLVVSDNHKPGDEQENIELVLVSKGINSNEFQLSLSGTNALIQYLGLLNEDSSLHDAFTIDQYNLSSYMKLDSSTMKALNIFSQFSSNGKSVSSIFELLNHCKTTAGSRLLSQWLKQPLTNLHLIEERQELVSFLLDDTSLRTFLSQTWLSQVPDIKRLMKKIHTGISKPSSNQNKKLEDVVRLYQLVRALPDLINMLEAYDGPLIAKYWLEPITKSHESLLKFQELIETTIDLSPLESSSAHSLLNTDFNIKPEFDESLVEINDKLQSSLDQIKSHHEQVGDDLRMELDKKLKLEKHQVHGWCFRVTRNDSAILRNTGNKYTQLQTVKAGVYFTTKDLIGLSKTYYDSYSEYNSKQSELIKEILSIATTYQLVFTALSLSLSHLDVLVSFANVAILAPTVFVRPKLHPMAEVNSPEYSQRKINLKDARHPVLEVQDDISFIPNDINMSNEEKSFVIITGPNMGGKSTYIRQIGVIALMSQVGSFIPVSEADPEIPIFDAILSRVGAGDSQLKGLSTFMIEMLETSSILATATHNSLIIIDELGRGTSTYDGFGLAWAILEHLISKKHCFTLFATHFHELTQLSTKYKQVDNLHVVAHVENDNVDEKQDDITLMYKVEPGISDKSFGIHVAELVKFPQKIINMAKRKALELQDDDLDESDKFIQNKKTKCTLEEIEVGISKLKKILRDWKQQCYDEEGKKCKVSSDEAIATLKEIVKSENVMNDDKFIKEMLSVL
jgi:DNA mismatch repair protein MSH2